MFTIEPFEDRSFFVSILEPSTLHFAFDVTEYNNLNDDKLPKKCFKSSFIDLFVIKPDKSFLKVIRK